MCFDFHLKHISQQFLFDLFDGGELSPFLKAKAVSVLVMDNNTANCIALWSTYSFPRHSFFHTTNV